MNQMIVIKVSSWYIVRTVDFKKELVLNLNILYFMRLTSNLPVNKFGWGHLQKSEMRFVLKNVTSVFCRSHFFKYIYNINDFMGLIFFN